MMMMRGITRSLARLPEQESPGDVSRKVFYGRGGMLGMMGGERMPLFPYLTEEEVATRYVYLATHPPTPDLRDGRHGLTMGAGHWSRLVPGDLRLRTV